MSPAPPRPASPASAHVAQRSKSHCDTLPPGRAWPRRASKARPGASIAEADTRLPRRAAQRRWERSGPFRMATLQRSEWGWAGLRVRPLCGDNGARREKHSSQKSQRSLVETLICLSSVVNKKHFNYAILKKNCLLFLDCIFLMLPKQT